MIMMDTDFLGPFFLLTTTSARELYREVAELPIIDAHNHANVEEIAVNEAYRDLWQVEVASDHYVWEMLRKRGIPERLITGDAPPREKWLAAAAAWEDLAGNPTYEWVYLDLKRLLNIHDDITADSAGKIWDETKAILAQPDMRPQELLLRMNVEAMCSTDDPCDLLPHHRFLQQQKFACQVRPTFRPDRAMAIYKADWNAYIDRLQQRVNGTFSSIGDLRAALRITHDYFAENGCIASDHGVDTPYAHLVDDPTANDIFCKARRHETLSRQEQIDFMAWMLHAMAELDQEKDWVFQLHIGAVRDVRDTLLAALGPDTGGDISDHSISIATPLHDLLNRFDDRLKIVLYALDPGHQATLAALTRAFGAKVNLGAAWWLNDSPIGMKRQLEYIGSVDLLANFSGMVSDSRKLFSYGSRHEVFRRVLCQTLGEMTQQGRMRMKTAVRLAVKLAYERPKSLFNL